MNNQILAEDVRCFAEKFELREFFRGMSFLITGATGLIGSVLIRCLLAFDEDVRIIAPVRNEEKARSIFGKDAVRIELITCDLLAFNYNSLGTVDYVIHCAAPTASKFFVEHPVETFDTILRGTSLLLEYARQNPVKSFVYLSSLEVYGSICDDSSPVKEEVQGYLDPIRVRSSYPMAKRATENLCSLYNNEYGVPVKIARLTQTTGAGIANDDNRVIAQFSRLAAEGKDIVLYTSGEAARPYCYTTDAISAILFILLKGKSGEAYNVANEETYISARGMAVYLREHFNPSINVRIEQNDNMGYAPVTKIRLNTEKLKALGWSPQYGLKEIFERLTASMK